MSNLSRRSLVTAAAALPAVALPAVAIASTAEPDPIYAAIEAHRAVHAEYVKASDAYGKIVGPRSARVFLGYFAEGVFSVENPADGTCILRFKPTGKKTPRFASSVEEIKRNVPNDLKGAARDAWIAERSAELERDEENVRQRWAKTKGGKLQAISDAAYEVECDRMWDLIWTQPTTLGGLAALLAYRRANEAMADLVHYTEAWQDVLDWTIEAAVCEFAGLPEPPMSEEVTDLASDEEETVV